MAISDKKQSFLRKILDKKNMYENLNKYNKSKNIYGNILDIKDKFDVFLLDAYGVFWDGSTFYQGSKETMKQLVDEGKYVFIVSNTTQTASDARASYKRKGLTEGVHYSDLITSGEVLRLAVNEDSIPIGEKGRIKKVYQFGHPNNLVFKDGNYRMVDNIEDADCVYISIPMLTEEQYNKYKDDPKYAGHLHESAAIKEPGVRKWNSTHIGVFQDQIDKIFKSGLPIINANPDFTALEGVKNSKDKKFVIRQGAIAEVLRNMGSTVYENGKPHISVYDLVFQKLLENGIEIDKERICMVGDTLRTDIKGANNAGISSVLCVSTGVTSNELKKGIPLSLLAEKEQTVVDYKIEGLSSGLSQEYLEFRENELKLMKSIEALMRLRKKQKQLFQEKRKLRSKKSSHTNGYASLHPSKKVGSWVENENNRNQNGLQNELILTATTY